MLEVLTLVKVLVTFELNTLRVRLIRSSAHSVAALRRSLLRQLTRGQLLTHHLAWVLSHKVALHASLALQLAWLALLISWHATRLLLVHLAVRTSSLAVLPTAMGRHTRRLLALRSTRPAGHRPSSWNL